MQYLSKNSLSMRSLYLMLCLAIISFGQNVYAKNDLAKLLEETPIEQGERIAHEFASALSAGDVERAKQYLDVNGLAKLVTEELDLTPAMKTGFMKGFLQSATPETLVQSFLNISPNEITDFNFKRTIDTEEFGPRPMIRIDFEEGGHEFVLLFINEDELIEDFYFGSKANLTSRISANAARMFVGNKRSFLSRMMSGKSVDNEMLENFQKMIAHHRNGDPQKAYESLNKLPEELLRSRFVIDMAIVFAQQLNDTEYMKQLSNLNKYYGDNESTAFMLVDYHFMNNDLDAALRGADQAMAFWGTNDAALLNLKSTIYSLQNNLDKAIEMSKLAVKNEPDFDGGYWNLATFYNAQGDYASLTDILQRINLVFNAGISSETIATVDEYQLYTESEEFKNAWE
jgi:hypothetical protein